MEKRGGPVSCPVCTLYMREGVTLQNHLNTHPKDQVIAALVKISAGEYRYRLANVSDCLSSIPAGALSSQELPVLARCAPSVSAQFPQAGSSHFTTAITYQHFLSSNGVPHYVSMPTILSEPGTSPASANQAAFMQMLYSPYTMQQQQQLPQPQQQQQQMQILNSISPPPHQQSYIRHVLSPSPSLFSPSHIHSQTMELPPASLTINIPFPTDSSATEFPSSSGPSAFSTAQTSTSSTVSQSLSLSTVTAIPTSGTSNSTTSVTGTSNSTAPVTGTSNSTAPVTGTSNSTTSVTGTSNSTASVTGTSNSTAPVTGTSNSTAPVTGTSNSTAPVTGTSNSTASVTGTSNSTESVTATVSSVGVVSEKEQSNSTVEVVSKSTVAKSSEGNQSSNIECSSSPRVHDKEQQTEASSFTTDSSTESCDIGSDDIASNTCFTAPCCSGKDETTQTTNSYDDTGMERKRSVSSESEKDKSEGDSENENERESERESENEHESEHEHESECERESEREIEHERENENENIENENIENDNEPDNHNKQSQAPVENAGAIAENLSSDVPQRSETNDPETNTVNESFTQAEDTNNRSEEPASNTDSFNNSVVSDMIQISGLVRNALEIEPPAMCVENNGEYVPSDYQGEVVDPNETPENLSHSQENRANTDPGGEKSQSSGYINVQPADSYTIINIDGLQVAVPGGLMKTSASLIIAPEGPTDVAETEQTAAHSEASLSNEPTLNIQTDETMPPRGELSEQESVGGNDSSMWAQAFNENEASIPCDLLARESWEASDGSDADTPPENDSMSSEPRQKRMCSLPPKLQLKQSLKEPRVYTCTVCNENFNCPKERRVHQSTSHSDMGESSKNDMSVEVKKKSNKRKGNLKPGVKQEGNGQGIKTENSFIEGADEGKATELTDSKNSSEIAIEISKTKTSKQKHSVHGYLCSRCPEMFSTLKLRTAHEYKIHQITKDVKNVCKTCNETFENEASFKDHLQVHPLECSHCGKCFKRRQNLDLHIRRHLDIKPHKCTVCDKAFVTKQKLAEHSNTHTGNAPIKCPMCDETFRRYSNLIQHKNRHHLKKKKKIKDFICRCGEIFHSKKKLEWHKETHDINPKRCTYCPERFVHVASLTRHIRKAHDCRYVPEGGRQSENVECNICGFVFLKGSMQVHMRMHKGERPFSCHVCGKDFTTKWNLQLHRWTHATRSAKPFKCKLCKSAFFRYTDLTAHENSHRNVRPFTCNFCGSRFIRKYNCIRHVREHEAGKAFRCTICNKTFHRSYYLKEHLRVHNGVRPFACHICGKASTTKSNHNKHVKIHHAREQVNTEG